MTPLCELAIKHKSDKGGGHLTYGPGGSDFTHNYTPAYHALLGHRRDSVRNVFEIGVNYGCGLRMWEEYFPHANIYGIDLYSALINEGRIRCFRANQASPIQLLNVVEPLNVKFDLIVDDGSHQPDHQLISMHTLLPFLAPEGVYVIEDLECKADLLGDQVPFGYIWKAVRCLGAVDDGGSHKAKPEDLLVVSYATT